MKVQNERAEKCSYLHPHNEVIKVMTVPKESPCGFKQCLSLSFPKSRPWDKELGQMFALEMIPGSRSEEVGNGD